MIAVAGSYSSNRQSTKPPITPVAPAPASLLVLLLPLVRCKSVLKTVVEMVIIFTLRFLPGFFLSIFPYYYY